MLKTMFVDLYHCLVTGHFSLLSTRLVFDWTFIKVQPWAMFSTRRFLYFHHYFLILAVILEETQSRLKDTNVSSILFVPWNPPQLVECNLFQIKLFIH